MTISSEVRKAGPFEGNDSTTVFPFVFKVFKAADLIVVRRNEVSGVDQTLVLTTDYSVTLNPDQNATPGGSITLVAGALASNFSLVISSDLPFLQETDLTNQGGFYPKVITNALDRLTIFCQQLSERLGRSLTLPITTPTGVSTELPFPAAGNVIGWDSAATALRNFSPEELATIVAYGDSVADQFTGDGSTTSFTLSNAPGSLYNLDVSINGVTQRPGFDYSWDFGTHIVFTAAPPAPAVPGSKNILVRYALALPQRDDALREELASTAGTGLIGLPFGGNLTDAIQNIAYIDAYEHLVVAGDWTQAINAAFATGLPVMPNPARTYSVSGVIQAKGAPILGAFKINPTRSAISSLGTFVFDPDKSKSEVKNNIKLLYCLRVYDLVELMYIRSMGFNMIFHGGDMTSERPGVDTLTALGLMLDNALTANLQVNMTTGHIINEDSMAIGYVNTFKDHPAVWGFSVFDEPTFNGATVARQAARLAALRPLTEKNLNVTDVIQNYAAFRNGYNPWARGYDTFFVDAYSHTIVGTEAENIAADLRDMRTAVGVAATHLPDANIVPMCGLFKSTNFTTNINQIKGTAPVLAKCAGGDFAVFAWDAVEAGLTSNVRTGSDLRDIAKSLCAMVVNGARIPTAYPIGGSSSNPDSRPPVCAALGVDLLKKRDYATAFLGSGTALGILKNGADGEFTSPLLSAGASIGALFFRGAFPVAITNIETKKNISMPLTFFDVTGAKSGSLTVHYSADGGGTVSPAALTYPFIFSGSPSVSLNFDVLTGDFWRGYKLAFAQSVNAPTDATNYRCGLHGFIVVSDW